MTSWLEEVSLQRLQTGGKLLVPFLTAGFPDEDRFLLSARTCARAGADLLEIGVPFSDPLADGPTIQRTSQRALECGMTLARLLDLLSAEGRSIGIPVVLMSYLNPIFRMGIETFSRRAHDAGVSGLLISDLPPDESPAIEAMFRQHGLDRIVLIAPTTLQDRISCLLPWASGFLYLVTRTGVTGAGAAFSNRLQEQVQRIRAGSSLPIVAGFGIRCAADVEKLRDLVDGVVIGARLLEILEQAATDEELTEGVDRFLRSMRQALDS